MCISYKAEIAFDATITEVWQYLTDSEQLPNWLGTCKIDLTEGGDYLVSSQITYLSGRHRIVKIVENKLLELDFFSEGWKGTVIFELQSVQKQTLLKVSTEMPTDAAPKHIEPFGYPESSGYFWGGAWQHALFNLRSSLLGREIVKLDLRKNNGHTVYSSLTVNASSQQIWKLLLSAKELHKMSPKFYLENTKIEAKVGGNYSYGWYPLDTPIDQIEDGPSKIIELEENKKLVTNWHLPYEHTSDLQWLLEPVDSHSCKLTLIHSSILYYSQGNIWSYRSGWTTALYAIRDYLEKKEFEHDWWKTES